MWLSCSSVGRKFVMALTGACLVLFVTFHCVMNAVAICWPAAYNSICEFLGANWYALIASVGLAFLFIVHIIYALMLTVQNRKARGNVRYSIEKRPKNVEWSSKNMLILGIVVLAFLVVHLIQFWAKMQLQEIRGVEGAIPPAAGTLFIQEAFSLVYTPIVYIIGFIALWFHMNHGFWSMFQSCGWDNEVWIARLKKIGCCWTTIVIALFVAQAIVFTVKAHDKDYLKDPALREQYKAMVPAMVEKDFGPDAAQVEQMMVNMPYEQASQQFRQIHDGMSQQMQQLNTPEAQANMKTNPAMAEQVSKMK
ncbi:MAG: succinate dehydrogenase cytochrome b subunit, partial [Muribaculaceae bacterium]|nr:succinate dehydrogenase cytochrome b subunit [Muribaculaceae bacterium]